MHTSNPSTLRLFSSKRCTVSYQNTVTCACGPHGIAAARTVISVGAALVSNCYYCGFQIQITALMLGTPECRQVTKAGGLDLYDRRCNRTDYLIGKTATQNSTVQYYVDGGYRPSACPGYNNHCWIYVKHSSGTKGWIMSDLPSQPQSQQCGPAPGTKYVKCCPGKDCKVAAGAQ